jgi:predicted DNA-binding WGR domain protein
MSVVIGRYENREDGHSKFWELRKRGSGFVATWGKIGSAADGGNGPEKVYTAEEAEKVVREKLKKGYELVA